MSDTLLCQYTKLSISASRTWRRDGGRIASKCEIGGVLIGVYYGDGDCDGVRKDLGSASAARDTQPVLFFKSWVFLSGKEIFFLNQSGWEGMAGRVWGCPLLFCRKRGLVLCRSAWHFKPGTIAPSETLDSGVGWEQTVRRRSVPCAVLPQPSGSGFSNLSETSDETKP